MHNIRDILHNKGTVVWSASPDETVLEAIRRMAEAPRPIVESRRIPRRDAAAGAKGGAQ